MIRSLMLLLAGAALISGGFSLVIHVRTNGSSSRDCWTGGDRLPCSNVPLAMEGLQAHPVETSIFIHGTTVYFLNTTTLIDGAENVAITGVEETVLNCSDKEAGIAFINSSSVTISRLTLVGCGSTNMVGTSYPSSSAAIVFLNSFNIFLADLFVKDSVECGLIIANNKINKASFVVYDSNFINGGVEIVFQSTIVELSVVVENCTFSHVLPTVKRRGKRAFALSFNEVVINSSLLINNCVFYDNYFGGFLFQFQEYPVSSFVSVNSSVFDQNICDGMRNSRTSCEGGAVRVEFLPNTSASNISFGQMNSTVLFTQCNFTSNYGDFGGGVSLVLSQEQSKVNIQFSSCYFEGNTGNVGSAIIAYSTSVTPPSCLRLHNSTFTGNEVIVNYGFADGLGAVYTNSVPLCLQGSVSFSSNTYSAVVISVTTLTISDDARVVFANNSGHSGGALALINTASLVVGRGAVLQFLHNTAHQNGGAIYVASLGYQNNFPSASNCFLKFSGGQQIHPNQWGVKFIFEDNVAANYNNSIYTPSMLPCVWSTANQSRQDNTLQTFCWKGWKYSPGACHSHVETAVAKLKSVKKAIRVYPGYHAKLPVELYDDYNNSVRSVLSTKLEQGSNVTIDAYVFKNRFTAHGMPETSHQLTLDTLLPRVLHTQINMTFDLCPPGFTLNETKLGPACLCENNYQDSVRCNCSKLVSYLHWGNFLFYNDLTNKTVGGSWNVISLRTKKSRDGYNPLPVDLLKLNDHMCHNLNRHGYLCAECINGTSAPANSLDYICVNCSDAQVKYNWIFFIAQEIIPVTVFFIVVVMFNIRATSGPACAFIFFAQMVTNPLTISHYTSQLDHVFPGQEWIAKILLTIFIVPYSIWNLDFFSVVVPPYCIFQGMKTIHSYVLQYVVAFYPLVLISICFVCIELHAHDFRPLVWFWKPIGYSLGRWKRNFEVRTSMIDVFATFLILSYTKFTLVSFYLLIPLHTYDHNGDNVGPALVFPDLSVHYGSSQHLIFMILAILVIIFIVSLPPLFLFVYQFKTFQKLFGRFSVINNSTVRTFVEAFQGTFKDGTNGTRDCRWFGSLYFFIRFLCFALILTTTDLVRMRLIQMIMLVVFTFFFGLFRPYKKEQHNNTDIFILTMLGVVIACAFYNAAIPNGDHSVNIVLMLATFTPLVFMFGLVLKLLCTRQRCCTPRKFMYLSSVVSPPDDQLLGEEEPFPDRLVRPGEYGAVNKIDSPTVDRRSLQRGSNPKKLLRNTIH